MKKPKYAKKDRMWAVEQAVRWPTVQYIQPQYSGALGSAQYTIHSGASGYYDADVIGRAEKLLKFIQD